MFKVNLSGYKSGKWDSRSFVAIQKALTFAGFSQKVSFILVCSGLVYAAFDTELLLASDESAYTKAKRALWVASPPPPSSRPCRAHRPRRSHSVRVTTIAVYMTKG